MLHGGEAPEGVALVDEVVRPRALDRGGELVVQGRHCGRVTGGLGVAYRRQAVNRQSVESRRRRLAHAGGEQFHASAMALEGTDHLLHVDRAALATEHRDPRVGADVRDPHHPTASASSTAAELAA